MKNCRILVLAQKSAPSSPSYTDHLKERLIYFLFVLLEKYERVAFVIGRDGKFEKLVAALAERAQRAIGAERVTVTHATHFLDGEFAQAHRHTVDGCDVLACFIDRTEGNAYEVLLYAQHHGKSVFNFAYNMLL